MRLLRRDDGSTDPILLIAGIAITLILLVGGSFGIAGFMKNAQDTNAKMDLDRVNTAQAAVMAASDRFLPLALGPRVLESKKNTLLAQADVGFVPSDDATLVIAVSPSGWAAMTDSGSGSAFLRTSTSSETIEVNLDDVRSSFEVTAVNGRILDAGESATTTGGQPTVRFPADLAVEDLARAWVDAIWGLVPGEGTGGDDEGEEEVPFTDPTFSAGPNVSLKSVVWTQTAPNNACAAITVVGTGAGKWDVAMDTSARPFNGTTTKSNFTFPESYGYGFIGDFTGKTAKVGGNMSGPWTITDTIAVGEERSFQVCNWTIPRPAPESATATVSNKVPGQWTWTAKVTVSKPDAKWLDSWKVQVDLSDLDAGYKNTTVVSTTPGKSDITAKSLGNGIYEFEGIGWPATAVGGDTTYDFVVRR